MRAPLALNEPLLVDRRVFAALNEQMRGAWREDLRLGIEKRRALRRARLYFLAICVS